MTRAPLFVPLGDAAARARLPDGADPRAVLDALRACAGVIDAVVTERHVAVAFDPARPPSGLEEALTRVRARDAARGPSRSHVVRVRYDGEDLDELGARTALGSEAVAAIHAGGRYVVARVGFLPGFAYLEGVDARIAIPRRATPRPRVPKLAVGIAGARTGVYPFASSGGWNLVGTAVDFAPFDAERGAALALGDAVTFERVT